MANLAKNASLSNQQKTLKPVAELHGKLVEKNSISEEIEDISVNVLYDDNFSNNRYVPKDEREKRRKQV